MSKRYPFHRELELEPMENQHFEEQGRASQARRRELAEKMAKFRETKRLRTSLKVLLWSLGAAAALGIATLLLKTI